MYLWKVLFIGSWTSHLKSPLGPSTIWRRTINFKHICIHPFKKIMHWCKDTFLNSLLQPPIDYTIKCTLFLVWITSTFCVVLVKHGRGNSQHFFPLKPLTFLCDLHVSSPHNCHASSWRQVLGICKPIRRRLSPWHNIKKSLFFSNPQ